MKIDNFDLMLLILYGSTKKKISGRLKLAKLLFIASREIFIPNVEIESSEFIPYKQGPYPVDFNDIIELGQEQNLIRVEDNEFQLTPEGNRIVEEVFSSSPEGRELIRQIVQTVRKFENVSDDIILPYVYMKYPGFTTKSEIRDYVISKIKKELYSFVKLSSELGVTEDEIDQALKEVRLKTLKKIYG